MKRFIAVMLGLLTAVALLEIGLRIASFLYLRSYTASGTPSSSPDHRPYVILCLGNSYTFGFGAPPGQSYPDQLQRLLDAQTGRFVKVINGGRGIENTTELLDTLEDRVMEVNPDLIVLQTGQANLANYINYSQYLSKKSGKDVRRDIFYLHDLLSKSRAYKLISLLLGNVRSQLKEEIPTGYSYRESKEYKKARELFHILEANFPFSSTMPPLDRQQTEEAQDTFLRGVEKDPRFPANYCALGLISFYQKDYDGAVQWFIQAVEADPNFRGNNEVNDGYLYIRLMRGVDKGPHNDALNKKIDLFAGKIKKNMPNCFRNLIALSEEETNAWVESDIKDVIVILRKRNIKIILQNYPMNLAMNTILRKMARELDVPLVDNEKIFNEKIRGGMTKEELFSPDGHCNARGYGVMAGNVYETLMETGFLKSHLPAQKSPQEDKRGKIN